MEGDGTQMEGCHSVRRFWEGGLMTDSYACFSREEGGGGNTFLFPNGSKDYSLAPFYRYKHCIQVRQR